MLKPTAPLFATAPTDLLDYALEHKGYSRHSELSCFTPLSELTDPLENCNGKCRYSFRQTEKYGLTYGELPDSEMEKFYEFLEGPLEMPAGEIRELPITALIEKFKELSSMMAPEGWTNFFKSLAAMIK